LNPKNQQAKKNLRINFDKSFYFAGEKQFQYRILGTPAARE